MSYYEHLHIYQTTYKLSSRLFVIVSQMDRNYRAVLGYRILDTIVDVVSYIVKINSLAIEDREEFFVLCEDKLNRLFLYIRIANDIKLFKKESVYVDILGELVKIQKMLYNWRNS